MEGKEDREDLEEAEGDRSEDEESEDPENERELVRRVGVEDGRLGSGTIVRFCGRVFVVDNRTDWGCSGACEMFAGGNMCGVGCRVITFLRGGTDESINSLERFRFNVWGSKMRSCILKSSIKVSTSIFLGFDLGFGVVDGLRVHSNGETQGSSGSGTSEEYGVGKACGGGGTLTISTGV